MAHIYQNHTSFMAHEVVIPQIGREIYLRTGRMGLVYERASGTRAYGHTAHPVAHNVAVTQRPHAKARHHPAHELPAHLR